MDWQLNSERASFEAGNWRITLDPRDPAAGMRLFYSSMQVGDFLRVAPKPAHSFTIQEAYVRQNDFIVRYEQSGDDLYTVQLNWRQLECELPDSVALELWISVQTSLLDTHPTIDVRSRTKDALWHGLTLNDLSLDKSDTTAIGLVKKKSVTGIVMLESSDALQSKRIHERSDEFTWRMFGQFMEKGVIRRARLRILAATGEIPRSKIAQQYRSLTDSPLPLTA